MVPGEQDTGKITSQADGPERDEDDNNAVKSMHDNEEGEGRSESDVDVKSGNVERKEVDEVEIVDSAGEKTENGENKQTTSPDPSRPLLPPSSSSVSPSDTTSSPTNPPPLVKASSLSVPKVGSNSPSSSDEAGSGTPTTEAKVGSSSLAPTLALPQPLAGPLTSTPMNVVQKAAPASPGGNAQGWKTSQTAADSINNSVALPMPVVRDLLSQSTTLETPFFYDKSTYFHTGSGNRVSKDTTLIGSRNMVLTGRSIILPNVILRGDTANIRIGKYVIVGSGSVISPPRILAGNHLGSDFTDEGEDDDTEDSTQSPSSHAVGPKSRFLHVTIGDHVIIGRCCVIQAAVIGSNVEIGEACVIGRGCIIRDNSKILNGTVLAPMTVVPPYTAFQGVPGVLVGELPEATHLIHKERAISIYRRFIAR